MIAPVTATSFHHGASSSPPSLHPPPCGAERRLRGLVTLGELVTLSHPNTLSTPRQEFSKVSVYTPSPHPNTHSLSLAAAMRIGAEVYHALRGIIIERYGALSASVGDEGGFAPDLADVAEALELIMAAIKATGHQDVVRIALDVAASELAVRFAALCLELVTPTCHTNSSHPLVTTSSLLCRRVCFCVPQLHRVFGHRGGGGNIKGLWCIKIKGLWCIAHILWLCV